jgi:hypothetical protein
MFANKKSVEACAAQSHEIGVRRQSGFGYSDSILRDKLDKLE